MSVVGLYLLCLGVGSALSGMLSDTSTEDRATTFLLGMLVSATGLLVLLP